jgi:hypothetical protein
MRASCCILLLALAGSPVAADLTVTVSGPTVDVWGAVNTLHKCGFIDVPDIPARAFVDDKGVTKMIVGDTYYHHMSGPSILNQTRECAYAFNQTADPDPSHFAGDEFLDSSIAFDNGTVISLIHTEYPGNVYNNTGPDAPMCTIHPYPTCWTVSIGLAISHDWGATWKHARPPPHHLVAAVPYGYNQSQLAYGWGDPSNIVKSPKDGLYYVAIWNRNQVGLQAPGICMMRTGDLMDPASWRAWDGTDYTVSLDASPYSMKPGTQSEHICTVTNLPAGDTKTGCAPAGMVWSDYLKKFVVTLGCGGHFKYATSDDLISWSATRVLDVKHNLAPNISKMVVDMNYPTFMDPNAPKAFGDKNYYTIGQSAYLFWSSIGHSPHTDGRHLLATPFTFQK